MTSTPLTVVAIMGGTRSGSTIFDNVLGQYPGCFSAGELHYLWERGVLEGRTCACGRRVQRCNVWGDILRRVHARVPVDARTIVEWQRRSVRVRHTWRLTRHRIGEPGPSSPLERYAELLGVLYESIAEATGASVIVDSSKRPSDAVLVGRLAGVRAFAVHLVRDPRAVTYSWRRHKVEFDSRPGDEMPRHGALYSTARWIGINTVSDLVRARTYRDRSLLVRYEDFASNPRSSIEAVAARLGVPLEPSPFKDERTVHLGVNHSVSGNPSRFLTGDVTIKPDNGWRTQLKAIDRTVTTTLAAPLLPRYGYAASLRRQQ